jgi:hypothetical protein
MPKVLVLHQNFTHTNLTFRMFAAYLHKYEIYCCHKQPENASSNDQRFGFTANFGADQLMICIYKAPFFSRAPFGPQPVPHRHSVEPKFQKWFHKLKHNNRWFDFLNFMQLL